MSINDWDLKFFSLFFLNDLAVQHLSFHYMKKMELLKCPGETTIPYEQSSLHGNIIFCGLLNFDSNVDKLILINSMLLCTGFCPVSLGLITGNFCCLG